MLASVGKLSSMGEILTINEASLPGELHRSSLDSLLTSFQLAGTLKDIPCRSHFASCPPSRVANCAGLATPCSAGAPLSPEVEDELEPDPVVDFPCLNFSERLHSERANKKTSPSERYFIIAT